MEMEASLRLANYAGFCPLEVKNKSNVFFKVLYQVHFLALYSSLKEQLLKNTSNYYLVHGVPPISEPLISLLSLSSSSPLEI